MDQEMMDLGVPKLFGWVNLNATRLQDLQPQQENGEQEVTTRVSVPETFSSFQLAVAIVDPLFRTDRNVCCFVWSSPAFKLDCLRHVTK